MIHYRDKGVIFSKISVKTFYDRLKGNYFFLYYIDYRYRYR